MRNRSDSATSITDEKLFQLCREYGRNALLWRQKFIGLLPEVNKRRLYEKKGFESIFVFAKKLAGLSEEQVRTALNLEKKFEDKPVLKSLLESGEVSINKLVRIQSVAKKETQEFWATQVQLLSNRALETLIQDERKLKEDFENKNTLQKPLFEAKSLHVQISTPELSDDVKKRLTELQQKGININELILKLLDQHEAELMQEKEKIAKEINERPIPTSRYIPIKVKRILQQEYGTKCSIPTCQKPAKTVHHTQRFHLAHTHDPNYLAKLCEEHHQIAHSIDLKFHEIRMKNRGQGGSTDYSTSLQYQKIHEKTLDSG